MDHATTTILYGRLCCHLSRHCQSNSTNSLLPATTTADTNTYVSSSSIIPHSIRSRSFCDDVDGDDNSCRHPSSMPPCSFSQHNITPAAASSNEGSCWSSALVDHHAATVEMGLKI